MTRIPNEFRVVGIIGLAKNTGKTTTLNWLIKHHKNESIGLTSIGLDGEPMDQIHFLPKPRIKVCKGMVIATAQSCLDESLIDYDVISKTNLFTSIGEILIVKIKGEGYLVIAGPTTNDELSKVLKMMKNHATRIFVDGAFNRMTFSNLDEIDGIILATGASVSPVMEETVEKTRRIVDLFHLDETTYQIINKQAKIIFVTDQGEFILNDKKISSIEQRLNHLEDIQKIIIKGAISENIIDCLINARKSNYELVGEDSSRFIFQSSKLRYLEHLNVHLSVLKSIKLLFLTMNPYRPTHQSYDPIIFMKALKHHIQSDIIDVMREE